VLRTYEFGGDVTIDSSRQVTRIEPLLSAVARRVLAIGGGGALISFQRRRQLLDGGAGATRRGVIG